MPLPALDDDVSARHEVAVRTLLYRLLPQIVETTHGIALQRLRWGRELDGSAARQSAAEFSPAKWSAFDDPAISFLGGVDEPHYTQWPAPAKSGNSANNYRQISASHFPGVVAHSPSRTHPRSKRSKCALDYSPRLVVFLVGDVLEGSFEVRVPKEPHDRSRRHSVVVVHCRKGFAQFMQDNMLAHRVRSARYSYLVETVSTVDPRTQGKALDDPWQVPVCPLILRDGSQVWLLLAAIGT
jgi:hypothetical protein